MRTLAGKVIKHALDSGEPLSLLAVLTEWQFRLGHIPGSIRFTTHEVIKETFADDEALVVYCQGHPSFSSEWAYRLLLEIGFTNILIPWWTRRMASGGVSSFKLVCLTQSHFLQVRF